MTASRGRFFEDFKLGEIVRHATPRTVTSGDAAFYAALYGGRFAVQCSDVFAHQIGYRKSPIDDLLVFHIVFGKTVADISLNAVANLGYSSCRFLAAVYPDDTLSVVSEIIGLKENSNRQSGVVYVRSQGFNQHGDLVLDFVRWVMVRKRDSTSPVASAHVPVLPKALRPDGLGDACPQIRVAHYDSQAAGCSRRFADYSQGERIDHVDGATIEEAEHQLATRLYQNTARVHFNQFLESRGRFGKRLVYGGHVISIARALSYNGLANAFHLSAVNAGRHVAPVFAGVTIFAWSEVLDKAEIPGRGDVGALRLRTIATGDRTCSDFPFMSGDAYEAGVVLDLDYWVLLPQ
jgi:2-methylfumaryl-CoA hydratase